MRENVCKTLIYQDLILRHDLRIIPSPPLPDGYSFRFYQQGDEKNWLQIEASAREFLCPEEGREAWQRYYGGKEEELQTSMLFVMDEMGDAVATATAFYDQKDEKAGWLHWMAVKREHQGKGISRPLVYRVLRLLKEKCYPYACVPTQTTTWLAVKVYLDCGFTPYQGSETGYRIISTLTGHKKLYQYPPMDEGGIHDPVMLDLERQAKGKIPRMKDFTVWTDARMQAGILDEDGKVTYFQLLKRPEGGYSIGDACPDKP